MLCGSEPATFVRLPNVIQTPWTFGIRWVVVVQTSLMGVWNTFGSRCTDVAGSLGTCISIMLIYIQV